MKRLLEQIEETLQIAEEIRHYHNIGEVVSSDELYHRYLDEFRKESQRPRLKRDDFYQLAVVSIMLVSLMDEIGRK